MPAALVVDISTSPGHGAFGMQKATQGSPDTNINNKPAHRKDDSWSPHMTGITANHNSTLSSASTKTFWNNKGAGRVGDSISCGSTAATGSSDTNID